MAARRHGGDSAKVRRKMRLEATKRFKILFPLGAVFLAITFITRGGFWTMGSEITTHDARLFWLVIGVVAASIIAVLVLSLTGHFAWSVLLWGLANVAYGIFLPSVWTILAGLCFIGCLGISRKAQALQVE